MALKSLSKLFPENEMSAQDELIANAISGAQPEVPASQLSNLFAPEELSILPLENKIKASIAPIVQEVPLSDPNYGLATARSVGNTGVASDTPVLANDFLYDRLRQDNNGELLSIDDIIGPSPQLTPTGSLMAPASESSTAPKQGAKQETKNKSTPKTSNPEDPAKAPVAPQAQQAEADSLAPDTTSLASKLDFLRAAEYIGAGLSGLGTGQNIKPNVGLVDAMQKNARDSENSVINKARTKSQLKLDAVKQSIAEDDLQKAMPDSEVSKLAGQFYEQLTGQKLPPGISYNQIDGLITNARLNEQMKENVAARRDIAKMNAETRADARLDKNEEKITKKQSAMDEVQTRRDTILTSLQSLKDRVKEDGTYEVFGSHNADIEREVELIATDMAKLMDPKSVARPSEVAQMKKILIQPGVTDMSNATALKLLDNFEKEVMSRTAAAYKVRGLEIPKTDVESLYDKASDRQSSPAENSTPVVNKTPKPKWSI